MEKKTVEVRGVRIGEGLPKICIPLTASDENELQKQLETIDPLPFDLLEWRADAYEGFSDPGRCTEALRQIRAAVGDVPVLFTIRTCREGGNADITYAQYRQLNLSAARSGADLVDVELFTAGDDGRQLVKELHGEGAAVIGSSHDFQKTPSLQEMLNRLLQMQATGMDIVKIAVMPQSRMDVLRLMEMTVLADETCVDRPVISMSMGKMGTVSRLSGTLTGSAVTFGTGVQASAPGQVPAGALREILHLLG